MAKKRLGDICNVVTGSTPKTNVDEYWDGDIKWITPAELTENTYILEDSVRKITELAVQKTGLSPFPKGTVILSSRAPIGKVAIAGCEMYCNQGFKNLICTDEIYNEYLYWFFKSKTEFLNSLGRGATFKEISKTIVENIEIELPSIKVQKEIARKLQKCSEVIVLRKHELIELNNLIKSRFVDMFGDNINPNYEVLKLSDFCKFQQGTQVPVEEQIEKPLEGYTRFLRIIDYTQAPQPPRYVNVKGREIDERSVVIVRYGATAGFVGHGYRGILANNLFEIIPNEQYITKDFLYLTLKYGDFEKVIHEKAFGAAMPALSFGMVGEITTIIPPGNLQEEFINFVAQVTKLKLKVQESLDETQTLMNSLMQKYFG